MYQIKDNDRAGKTTLLIPAMMDDHMDLLRFAFASKRYHPVVLTHRQGVEDAGLRYGHNDMCYPFTLALGQAIQALRSGDYDPETTALLVASAGDACRGSNFAPLIRKGLADAGYPQVAVLSLNVKGVDRGNGLKIEPHMAWRALFALYYGDMLQALTHQTRPYEAVPGAANACRAQWLDRLTQDMKTGRDLTLGQMKRNFSAMAADFAAIPRVPGEKKRVALVGELYTKGCALGNWDLVDFLEGEGCQVTLGGFSWYILYYISSQIAANRGPRRAFWRLADRFMASIQRTMVAELRTHGFHSLETFPAFRDQAWAHMSPQLRVADGWLMGGEVVGHVRGGCTRVLAVQPFGCLPNHVCGRGQYAALVRKFPGVRLVSVDLDSSGAPSQVYNRVKLLLEG